MAKRIIQVILVLLFLVLVIVGIVVGSYVFSSPKTDLRSESRLLITGAWEDKERDRKFAFDENGNFSVTELESDKIIADGYYRINEDRDTIKLFMFPGHYEDEFKKHVKFICFAQITYSDLVDPANGDKKNKTAPPPTATFFVKLADNDAEGELYKVTMPEKTLDLYSKGKRFTAKKR